MKRLRLFVRFLAATRSVIRFDFDSSARCAHRIELNCVRFWWTFCHSPFRSNEPIAKLYFFPLKIRFGSVRVCFIWFLFVSISFFFFFHSPFRFAFSGKMSRHLPCTCVRRTAYNCADRRIPFDIKPVDDDSISLGERRSAISYQMESIRRRKMLR